MPDVGEEEVEAAPVEAPRGLDLLLEMVDALALPFDLLLQGLEERLGLLLDEGAPSDVVTEACRESATMRRTSG